MIDRNDLRLNNVYRIEILDGAMVVFGRYWSTYRRPDDSEDFVLILDESNFTESTTPSRVDIMCLPARQITKIEELEKE